MLNDQFGLQVESNFIKSNVFREHSDQKVQNYQIKGLWNINEDSTLKLNYQYYNADACLPGALSAEDYERNRWQSTRSYDAYHGRPGKHYEICNITRSSVSPVNLRHRAVTSKQRLASP